jgi:hypothetical protein
MGELRILLLRHRAAAKKTLALIMLLKVTQKTTPTTATILVKE